MCVERVAILWVVNASSDEKSCLQFPIPTESGAGGERGVSHSLNVNLSDDGSNFRKVRATTDVL